MHSQESTKHQVVKKALNIRIVKETTKHQVVKETTKHQDSQHRSHYAAELHIQDVV